MADLSSFADSDALDNRYSGKTIIYVEGEPDEKIYQNIVGYDMAHLLEFKVPNCQGSGCAVVINEVKKQRETNQKVFGLLDGEEAVSLGGLEAFVGCTGQLFSFPAALSEGLFFLSGHEVENILILYGKFCEHISKETTLRDLGKLDINDIQRSLYIANRRFFMAALAKYASRSLKLAGKNIDIVATGRFQNKDKVKDILSAYRKDIEDAGLKWSDFVNEARKTMRLVRGRFKAQALQSEEKNSQLIRMTDGKGLLTRMKQKFNPQAKWEGHLAHTLYQPEYADRFRNDLIILAGISA